MHSPSDPLPLRARPQLSALGELHLDRCLADLRTRFARVDIQVRQHTG